MIKGIHRQMIEVTHTGSPYFERAFLVVEVDQNIQMLLMTAYGKEGKEKITEANHDAIAAPYRAANEYGLVDALNIEQLIKSMRDEIEAFETEVDTCLQISNSITMIEIE